MRKGERRQGKRKGCTKRREMKGGNRDRQDEKQRGGVETEGERDKRWGRQTRERGKEKLRLPSYY